MDPSVVVSGVVGFGFGLSKDIVFSWLKVGRQEDGIPKKCSDQAERIVKVEQKIEQHEKDLSSGNKKFDKFQESISNIEKNVEVLVDRAKNRRDSD